MRKLALLVPVLVAVTGLEVFDGTRLLHRFEFRLE